MSKLSRRRGADYELIALQYLQQQGLTVVSRNFLAKMGEIDLIMRHNAELVFVEVRMRQTNQFGTAAETVSWHKQRKLINTAEYFLLKHPQFQDCCCRFDVIAIDGPDTINWHQSAFSA